MKKLMSEDKKIRDLILRAMAECAMEYSEAPEEDRPVIITRWVDNVYALASTMVVHDLSEVEEERTEE